jgi:hypothetical protein
VNKLGDYINVDCLFGSQDPAKRPSAAQLLAHPLLANLVTSRKSDASSAIVEAKADESTMVIPAEHF